MGRHASADGRRRIAAWPIVLAVVVLLLVGLTITYVLIVSPDRKTAACTGNTVLPVTASPGAGRSISDAATAFNATNPIARSTCVSVSVSTMPARQPPRRSPAVGRTPPRPRRLCGSSTPPPTWPPWTPPTRP